VLLVAVSAAWATFFSSLLRIESIVVIGVDGEYAERVEHFLTGDLIDTNLLLIDIPVLIERLSHEYPELEQGRIERVWPHEVRFELARRIVLGTWCRATEPGRPCYYFDLNGATWGESLPSSGTLLMTVIDERPEGDLQAELLDHLLQLSDGVAALDIATRQIVVQEGPLGVVTFVATEGYDVRFSRYEDIEEQLEVLGAFLSDRRASGDVPTLYMDVTVPGRVYFR